MVDELIDIFDENNEPLNIQRMKSEAHKIGLWHRAAHVWIYNSKGEILLQLRAKVKELRPNEWDISIAGHVSAGEDVETSAVREVKEEIGLDIKKEDLEFIKVRSAKVLFKEMINNEHYYVHLLKHDEPIDDSNLQIEEVEKIEFVPIDDLEEGLRNNPNKYVPHGEYWDLIIKEVKKRVSAKS